LDLGNYDSIAAGWNVKIALFLKVVAFGILLRLFIDKLIGVQGARLLENEKSYFLRAM
jgi:hypothetical protein